MFSIFKLLTRRKSALREADGDRRRDNSSRRDMYTDERKRRLGLADDDKCGRSDCPICGDVNDDTIAPEVVVEETSDITYFQRPNSFDIVRLKTNGELFIHCWDLAVVYFAFSESAENLVRVKDKNGQERIFVKLSWLRTKDNEPERFAEIEEDVTKAVKENSI